MSYKKSNINNNDIREAKKIIEEKIGVNANNLSQDDLKDMIISEINNNKNINIDESIKQKINNGDIDGLKEEAIKYLTKNKLPGGSNEKLMNMLQNNDMEGLTNQLMGMLLGNLNSQKKNEVNTNNSVEIARDGENNPLKAILNNKNIMNMLMSQMFSSDEEDNRVILLNAMKPFLGDTRCKSIDDCIKILSVISFMQKKVGKAGE